MKRLHLALWIVVLLPATLRAEADDIVSLPVGFARVRVPAKDRVLASMPFHVIDESAESMLQDGDRALATIESTSGILTWDRQHQRYVEVLPQSEDSVSEEGSSLALLPGQGFWLQNGSDTDQNVYLWGQVVLDASISTTLVPEYNLIAYPYTGSRRLERVPNADDESLEAALAASPADRLYRYASNEYWAASTQQSGNGLVWQSQTATGGTARMDMASAYFYQRDARSRATWREPRPYADAFPTNSRIGIADLSTDADGDLALVILPTGEPGERLDVFYQDLAPSETFSATSGWNVAALDIPVNGAQAIEWTDSGSHSRPKPSHVFARCYMIARADIDADLDGTADGRELFLLHTPVEASVTSTTNGTEQMAGTNITDDVRSGASDGRSPPDSPGRRGKTVYVSARDGNDAFSGRRSAAAMFDGPKRTVRCGLGEARPGDTLIIRDGAYAEDLNVAGKGIKVRMKGRVNLSRGGMRKEEQR